MKAAPLCRRPLQSKMRSEDVDPRQCDLEAWAGSITTVKVAEELSFHTKVRPDEISISFLPPLQLFDRFCPGRSSGDFDLIYLTCSVTFRRDCWNARELDKCLREAEVRPQVPASDESSGRNADGASKP